MKHNNSDSQLAAALNKPVVSGKQPDYQVIRAAAVIHAEQYKVNQDNFDMMKYSINDFIAGAQWALSQVACASSGEAQGVSAECTCKTVTEIWGCQKRCATNGSINRA